MSKKLKKQQQHQMLVEKSEKEEAKKVKKTLLKYVDQVNKHKKQDNNIQNQLKTINEIKENLQKKEQNYINLLNNLDITPQTLAEFVTKPLPDEITDIKSDQGFSHYLIDRPQMYFKQQDSLTQLIESSSFLWKLLKLKYEMNEQNREKLIQQLLLNFKNVDQNLFNCLQDKFKTGFTYKQLKLNSVREYTGNSYGIINSVLVYNDPVKLSAMSQYLHLVIKSYEDGDVAEPFQSNQLIYRNIKLPKHLLSLYKCQSFIYFTNKTSTSYLDLESFGTPDQTHYGVKFVFKLLDMSSQMKNKLFTGLKVQNISYYPSEQEVLILPYQLFQIKNIQPNGQDKYIIYMDEIQNKQILDEIRKPCNYKIEKPYQTVDKSKFLEALTNSESILKQNQKNAIASMKEAFNDLKTQQNQYIKLKETNKLQQQSLIQDQTHILDQSLPPSILNEGNQQDNQTDSDTEYQEQDEENKTSDELFEEDYTMLMGKNDKEEKLNLSEIKNIDKVIEKIALTLPKSSSDEVLQDWGEAVIRPIKSYFYSVVFIIQFAKFKIQIMIKKNTSFKFNKMQLELSTKNMNEVHIIVWLFKLLQYIQNRIDEYLNKYQIIQII